jgi:hypothetical protein
MAEPAEVLNRKIAAGDQVAKECSEVEEAIAALRMSYEQYFLGMERRPPTTEHNDLKKRLQQLKGHYVRQTALKFRVQSIQAKFATYERLWSRTLQEIEAGTYRRDLYKAKLHQKEQKEKAAEKEAPPEKAAPPQQAQTPAQPAAKGAPPPAKPGAPATPAQGKAAAPAAPGGAPARPAAQAPAPGRPPAAAAASGAGGGLAQALSDQKLRAVYDAYVTAKRRCQEDVSKLSYEQVAANLRKQVPDLVKKSGAQGVEFKIVIKDGKAILRALPK